jgi:hypothetical protein
MGLTALIPNGGALQGHQIPKGFALGIFLFSTLHKQACVRLKIKKSLSKTGILRHLR